MEEMQESHKKEKWQMFAERKREIERGTEWTPTQKGEAEAEAVSERSAQAQLDGESPCQGAESRRSWWRGF